MSLSYYHIYFFSQSPGDVFLNKTEKSLGSKYKKAVYREYTDDTFTTCKDRNENDDHLGILGNDETRPKLLRPNFTHIYLYDQP